MIWPRRRGLQYLDRLERGVLDSATPLADLLRLVLVMGGHASAEPLKEWALRELQGYVDVPDEVPAYRRVFAPIQANTRTAFNQLHGETISTLHLPEPARGNITEKTTIYLGVAQVESLIAQTPHGTTVPINIPGSAELRTLMSASEKFRNRSMVVDALYWAVTPYALQNIVDQVRTRLTQFVAEMRTTLSTGDRQPTPEQVRQVVQHIWVTAGDHSPVTVTAPVAYAAGGSTADVVLGSGPDGAELGLNRVAPTNGRVKGHPAV
ncbi:hypothetical protein [Streptomyces sp. NPDC058661]|uniref:AbiTii domain-containing protein n=1 Tax=Streptomyces sp. NPDC058661 TaxID=3346582 RepID=UPI00365D15D6